MKKLYYFMVASLFSVLLVSAAPTTGLQFSGVTASYIDLGQQTAFAPAEFTIEAWVNFQSLSGAYLFSTEGSDGASGGNQGFVLHIFGSKMQLQVGSDAAWPNVTGATDISLNTWYHVAATYSATEMKIYINGVLDGSATITNPMVTSVQHLCIGEGSMWKDRRFTGKMADLRFWNVVRTEAEVATDMTATLTGTEAGLVAGWKMNEGTGSAVADIKNALNITLPAEVTWFVPSVDQEITIIAPTNGLVFNGMANSLVDLGNNPALTSPAEFTIETVANFSTLTGGYILATEAWGTAGQGFSFRIDQSHINFNTGTDTGWNGVTAPEVAALDVWTHIAVTYSATAMKLYVNGLEVDSKTNPPAIGISTQNLIMGEGAMWRNRGLNGKLGYVRIWNVAKTKQEIRDNANTYVTGSESGLLAAWNNKVQNATILADVKGLYPGTIGSDVAWFGLASGVNTVNNLSSEIETTFTGRTLIVSNKTASKLQFSIFSITGQKLMNEFVGSGSRFEKQLSLQKGSYILNCVAENGNTLTKKFIISE